MQARLIEGIKQSRVTKKHKNFINNINKIFYLCRLSYAYLEVYFFFALGAEGCASSMRSLAAHRKIQALRIIKGACWCFPMRLQEYQRRIGKFSSFLLLKQKSFFLLLMYYIKQFFLPFYQTLWYFVQTLADALHTHLCA